jgi:hypothetical protein
MPAKSVVAGLIGPLSDADLVVTVGRRLNFKIFGINGGNTLKMGGRILTCTHIEPRFRSHFRSIRPVSLLECAAGTTGLEPATSAVTGQYFGVNYRK